MYILGSDRWIFSDPRWGPQGCIFGTKTPWVKLRASEKCPLHETKIQPMCPINSALLSRKQYSSLSSASAPGGKKSYRQEARNPRWLHVCITGSDLYQQSGARTLNFEFLRNLFQSQLRTQVNAKPVCRDSSISWGIQDCWRREFPHIKLIMKTKIKP